MRHLEGRFGRLGTPVADVTPGTRPRLFFGEGRNEAEGHRSARGQRHRANPSGRFARDVLEMWRLSTNHDAHARDAGVTPGRGKVLRGERQHRRGLSCSDRRRCGSARRAALGIPFEPRDADDRVA